MSAGGDGLIVGEHGVSIDLAGHAIFKGESEDEFGRDGTGVRLENIRGATVANGRIIGFSAAVHLRNSRSSVVRDLELSANAWGVLLEDSDLNQVSDLEIDGETGIRLVSSDRNRIQRTRFQPWDNGDSNEDFIVLIDSHHNVIRRNGADGRTRLEGSHGNLLRENSGFSESGVLQVINSHRNRIIGNKMRTNNASDSSGVSVIGHDNYIAENSFSGDESGLGFGGSRNWIIRNIVQGNQIAITGSGTLNVVRDNEARGGQIGILIGGGEANRVVGNVAHGNSKDGIEVGEAARDTRVGGNTVFENGDDGIDVKDPTARISGNIARDNGDYGIEAVPGVRAHHNSATGNGNPDQCLNVECGAP